MSNSTLSIFIPYPNQRFVEVPCRLPEAFNFKSGGRTYSVELSSSNLSAAYVYRVEHDAGPAPTADEFTALNAKAQAVLTTIKATLGITGPVPHGSPLPAIALAYEAEIKAFDAQVRAYNTLPAIITAGSEGFVGSHPADNMSGQESSHACRMLAKYVEHVFENAAKEVK